MKTIRLDSIMEYIGFEIRKRSDHGHVTYELWGLRPNGKIMIRAALASYTDAMGLMQSFLPIHYDDVDTFDQYGRHVS